MDIDIVCHLELATRIKINSIFYLQSPTAKFCSNVQIVTGDNTGNSTMFWLVGMNKNEKGH